MCSALPLAIRSSAHVHADASLITPLRKKPHHDTSFHMSQEFDRSNTDELINVAQSCRRIATHRASLQQRAIAK